jgi:hypothetical protein
VEVAIVAEELGRGLADAPFTGPTLAAELRRRAGASPTTDVETVALTRVLDASVSVVDGRTPDEAVAIDARGATHALALVPGSSGRGLAQIALRAADGHVDLTRPAALADKSVAPVPLGEQGRLLTDADLAGWTALGLVVTCADLVGVMRGAVQLACDYASSRQQYGSPIGSFQAIQHLLADAFVATEGARSVTLHAAWALDAEQPDEALASAAAAKAYCARAARTACETAIQVHGGIGNTWECLAHVYLRRALMSSDVLGGVGVSLARVLSHHGITANGGHDGLR